MQAVADELELAKCMDTMIGGSEVLYDVKVRQAQHGHNCVHVNVFVDFLYCIVYTIDVYVSRSFPIRLRVRR